MLLRVLVRVPFSQAEIQKAAQAQASETIDIWDTVHKPTPTSAYAPP